MTYHLLKIKLSINFNENINYSLIIINYYFFKSNDLWFITIKLWFNDSRSTGDHIRSQSEGDAVRCRRADPWRRRRRRRRRRQRRRPRRVDADQKHGHRLHSLRETLLQRHGMRQSLLQRSQLQVIPNSFDFIKIYPINLIPWSLFAKSRSTWV